MSESCMLELLSVTSNAVKALDRTSSSKSSGSGGGTPRKDRTENAENQPPSEPLQDVNNRSAGDSGVGESKTLTQLTKAAAGRDTAQARDSDDSTTASDLLIRTTLAENPIQRSSSLNSSASSRGSRCFELDNFNVADARKVKVSKKQLREIVPSPLDSDDSEQQHGHLKTTGLEQQPGSRGYDFNTNNNNKIKAGLSDVNNYRPESAKPGIPTKHFSGSDKSFPGQRKMLNQGVSNSAAVYTVERHGGDQKQVSSREFPSDTDQGKQGKGIAEDEKLSSGQYSYKISKRDGPSKDQLFVEPKELPEVDDWEDEGSMTSSQPEIVTVTERVVNVSSQALLLSDMDDSASQGSAVEMVSAANRVQSFPRAKTQGPGLRQGALRKGPSMPEAGKGDDVQISKFSLTDKQREVREALAKRGSQSKPVKRVVQPKVVYSSASSVTDEGSLNKNNNMDTEGGGSASARVGNMETITAAVAASAAAAATQPFLKMQQDMENKMQSLLAEMGRIQKQATGSATSGTADPSVTAQPDPRLDYLERQVKELTERRLEHLETLQSQQMEVQAHLLSMTRGVTHSHHQRRQQPTSTCHPAYFPTHTHAGQSSRSAYDRALIERELMKGRLQGEESGDHYYAQKGGAKGKVEHQEVESVLDTPNPRSRPPRPAEFAGTKGGFLQEILTAEPSPQLNTTFSRPPGRASPTRSRREDAASPVEKARKLALDLSNLEEQTKDSLWTDLKSGTRTSKAIADDPAPLEYYLKRVRDTNTTPYPKLHGSRHRDRSASPVKHTPSTSTAKGLQRTAVVDAPVLQDKYGDARNVLQGVMSEKDMLEKNLELMLRSRHEVDVYSVMGGTAAGRSDMTRIQKMVEKRISGMTDQVKREAAWDVQHGVSVAKSSSCFDVGIKPSARGVAVKPTVGFGSGAPRMSRIDTGLHKSRSVPNAATTGGRGKKIIKAHPAPKKSKIPYEDEEAMTQIYGKAQYQKGRTTVKDPYLHFRNQDKPRATRLPSPKRADDIIDMMSIKVQAGGSSVMQAEPSAAQMQGGQPRQYYFSPTRGYIPITPSAAAPVVGQLVSMAIPLGKPRMEPGLAVARDNQPYPVSAGLSAHHPVTAGSNVAMVAMATDDVEPLRERAPELGKQVLPPVDINSLSPTSSPRGSDIDVKDRANTGYVETVHYQESEEEEDVDRTLTESASDEEDQQGTGISLPGYHQPTPARDTLGDGLAVADRAPSTALLPGRTSQLREHGKVPWEERSDELAEDLRTRDILQNKAKYWLEQELMARMMMKMYPVMSTLQTEHLPEQDDAAADRSDSIPDDESLLVGDTIGQKGLQLFVDAGQPVNNNLVNALVREVIAEKVGGMLGRRREADSADAADRAAQSRAQAARGGAVSGAGIVEEETELVRPSRSEAQRVPTPQPTPRTSPVPGYVSQHAPATPPLTPPPPPLPPRERSPVKDVSSESSAPAAAALHSAATSMTPQLEPAPAPVMYETDTELSASLDLSEELRALDGKLKPAESLAQFATSESRHDVRTPTTTPPPQPPSPPLQQRPATTPPPSPPPPAPTPDPAPVKIAPPPPKEEVAVVAKSQAAQSKSPQPWGDPDSPGPELNPNYEDPSDGMRLVQPPPVMMSVAVGTETLQESPRRSPSPQRRRGNSIDHTELDSESSASELTDTYNENLSEGQWLVSRSEGQVAGLPLDEGVHRMMEANAARRADRADTSTASTLRDTDDLDLDDTDVSRSEGEFLHKGDIINPESDPVLALLMQMQHHPGSFRQYDLPPTRVQQVLTSSGSGNGTDRSLGEVMRNGGQRYGAFRQSMGELSEGQVLAGGGGHGVTIVTPKAASPPPRRESEHAGRRTHGDQAAEARARSASPGGRRSGNGNAPRSRTPPGPRGRQQQYQPVHSGLPPSQSRRPLKSALVRSSEDSRPSFDSEADSERRGPPTEYGTRTLTPDQMNMDALVQSGTYMSRSVNSTGRQGSTKKSVDFDLTGTYESHRESYRASQDDYSSNAGTSDRLTSSGRSLGLRYSTEESFSERGGRSSSHLRMSVTIPTTEGGSESDVSEIDLSDNTGY